MHLKCRQKYYQQFVLTHMVDRFIHVRSTEVRKKGGGGNDKSLRKRVRHNEGNILFITGRQKAVGYMI